MLDDIFHMNHMPLGEYALELWPILRQPKHHPSNFTYSILFSTGFSIILQHPWRAWPFLYKMCKWWSFFSLVLVVKDLAQILWFRWCLYCSLSMGLGLPWSAGLIACSDVMGLHAIWACMSRNRQSVWSREIASASALTKSLEVLWKAIEVTIFVIGAWVLEACGVNVAGFWPQCKECTHGREVLVTVTWCGWWTSVGRDYFLYSVFKLNLFKMQIFAETALDVAR